MSASKRHTLLEPGHDAEWSRINREKAEIQRAHALSLSPAQRIEEGQKLSRQAVSLLSASVKGGHVPRRALWS